MGNLEGGGAGRDPGQRGELARRRLERSHEESILDILAEGFEGDFARRKSSFRCAEQPPRVVENANDLEGSGMRPATLPDPKGDQRIDRAVEKRGGAGIRNSPALCDKRRFHSG